MATLPAEFQDLADELINDEFAAFRKSMSVYSGGTYNPATEATVGQRVDSYLAIPAAIDFKEYQSLGLEISDIQVVYTPIDDFIPPVGARVTLESSNYRILSAIKDTAAASIRLFLRSI